MRTIIFVGVLFLTGCAEVVGNDVSGAVENASTNSEAFRLAEGHCAKYGKKARVTQSMSGRMTFDCV
jgi:hypothetical protein